VTPGSWVEKMNADGQIANRFVFVARQLAQETRDFVALTATLSHLCPSVGGFTCGWTCHEKQDSQCQLQLRSNRSGRSAERTSSRLVKARELFQPQDAVTCIPGFISTSDSDAGDAEIL